MPDPISLPKYDPFGRRVEKRVEGLAPQVPVPLTTTYLYDGADIVLESVADGSTTVTTQYVHGPGIDEPLAMVRNGQSYFYHADGLGSIVALSDSTPAVVQQYAYDAFGMLTPSNPTFENAYTFTGREWDPELGLYYYRARYYDPMEGRFISKDPIGFAGGDVNVYRYVQNNLMNLTDPSGLESFSERGNRLKNQLSDAAQPLTGMKHILDVPGHEIWAKAISYRWKAAASERQYADKLSSTCDAISDCEEQKHCRYHVALHRENSEWWDTAFLSWFPSYIPAVVGTVFNSDPSMSYQSSRMYNEEQRKYWSDNE